MRRSERLGLISRLGEIPENHGRSLEGPREVKTEMPETDLFAGIENDA